VKLRRRTEEKICGELELYRKLLQNNPPGWFYNTNFDNLGINGYSHIYPLYPKSTNGGIWRDGASE
jgi:hypothetical protein